MKIKTCLLVFALLAVFLASCGSAEPREVRVDNRFKMDIPAYMSSTRNLNDDATLQFQNPIKEMYTIVIEDDSELINEKIIDEELEDEYPLGFEGFCRMVMDFEDFDFLHPEDWNSLKDETINGLYAKTLEDTRRMGKVDIYYKIALIKGEKTYYQLIAWTLGSRKGRYAQTIRDMVESFTELPH